jgi:hypothetical protein
LICIWGFPFWLQIASIDLEVLHVQCARVATEAFIDGTAHHVIRGGLAKLGNYLLDCGAIAYEALDQIVDCGAGIFGGHAASLSLGFRRRSRQAGNSG